MPDDDLDLTALPDDELVGQMHADLYDGRKDEVVSSKRSIAPPCAKA